MVVTTLKDATEWSESQARRSIFLDRSELVKALGYVLLMTLLVSSLIEHQARVALQDEDEPMERPVGQKFVGPLIDEFSNGSRIYW